MRSDRDKSTDKELEIDSFLSQFDDPADDSADYSSYLSESDTTRITAAQNFNWKKVESPNLSKIENPEEDKEEKAEVKQKKSRKRKSSRRKNRSVVSDTDNPAAVMTAEELQKKLKSETPKTDTASKDSKSPSDKQSANKKRKSNSRKKNNYKKKTDKQVEDKYLEDTEKPVTYKKKQDSKTKDQPSKKTDASSKKKTGSKQQDSNADRQDSKKQDSKADKQDSKQRDTKVAKKTSSKSKKKTDTKTSKATKPGVKDKKPETKAEEPKAVSPKPKHEAKPEPKAEEPKPKHEAKPEPKAEEPKETKPKAEKKPFFKPRKAKDEKKKEKAGAAATSVKKVKPAKKQRTHKSKRSLAEFLFLKQNKNYDPSKGPTYEIDGKTIKNKPLKFSIFKLFRDFVFIGLCFVFAFMVYALACITTAPKYDFTDVYAAVDTASIVYDDQGKQVDNIFYLENRKIVPYDQMPKELINSFVAIEDKTFWKHHGFNWTRMIGAVLSSVLGNGRISGTSTITQQLARNVYLSDTKSERSIKRKILEMYYASRLERSLTKEQIMEAYLNTIYLGHGCYGINSAARTYFSKSVKDLNLVESASLAALPQSPDIYALLKLGSEAQNVVDSEIVQTDPETVVTNDITKGRRQLTLDLMLDQELISKEEHDKVYDLSLNDFIKPSLKSNSSEYSYFHEYLVDTIIADLQEVKGLSAADAERMVYTGGLQIYSTVDSKAQKTIAKEFQDGSNFPYVTAPLDYDGNMLNNDGQIALYKYSNFFDKKGNFRLSGSDGDVKVNDDGSITIMAGKKLHIYETSVAEGTDYSLEFKNYYLYDDNDILYSIQGGYVNVPMNYKTADSDGNVTISADFFSDPLYEDAIKIDGKDVILTKKGYTLSSRSRQPQAAMTIVGVGTGEVKAMVGGRQFGGKRLLNRSLVTRQPGSSIKPLAVYGAALEKSYELAEQGKKWTYTDYKIDRQGTKGWGDYVTTHSSIEDERTRINGKYWPKNANNAFTGTNTFKTAVQKSINTCAVKLQMQVGADFSIEQLKKFGITSVIDDTSQTVNDVNTAALALGAMSEGVEPLEMALAYASFPAGGKVNTPICYYKVLDRNGEVLLEGKSKQSEAINEGVAWIMTDVLKSVVNYNRYMYVEGVEPGGKTGTTNDQYDIWFDGFTPSYAAALWIGTDENVEMSSMSTPAAALWGKIINQLPKAKKGEYAKMPKNVIQKGGDYYTKGTETGLTSWSMKAAREKARKAAYNKWLKEREKHKKQVCDDVPYDVKVQDEIWENRTTTESVKVKDAWTEEKKMPPDEEHETEWIQYIDHPAEYQDQTVTKKVKVQDAKYETRYKKECHEEYESGWETFKYND